MARPAPQTTRRAQKAARAAAREQAAAAAARRRLQGTLAGVMVTAAVASIAALGIAQKANDRPSAYTPPTATSTAASPTTTDDADAAADSTQEQVADTIGQLPTAAAPDPAP